MRGCDSWVGDHYRREERGESEVGLAEEPGPWSVVGVSGRCRRTHSYRENAGISEAVEGQSVGDTKAAWSTHSTGCSTEVLGMTAHCRQERAGRDGVGTLRSLEGSRSVQQEADM